MDTFTYFAYGSNMLTERLRARCPSAEHTGTAVIHGYDIQFTKESRDKSGKATLVKTEEDSNVVYGSLFRINKNEITELDIAEGAQDGGYKRDEDFQVVYGNRKISVTAYIAPPDKCKNGLPLYDWYFALVMAGALQHGLLDSYIEELRRNNKVSDDPKPERLERIKALCILEQSGYEAVYKELASRLIIAKENPLQYSFRNCIKKILTIL